MQRASRNNVPALRSLLGIVGRSSDYADKQMGNVISADNTYDFWPPSLPVCALTAARITKAQAVAALLHFRQLARDRQHGYSFAGIFNAVQIKFR